MQPKTTTGFQDLVYFLARPKTVIFALILGFGGGVIFRSIAFIQLILVPVGICVALVLLDLTIAIAIRLMGLVINPDYRRGVIETITDAWRGRRR
ncbi:hypothetical protein N7638_25015 [Achromobacter mucicolens]|uniref:hypothetical protein n=1 Tax=Achromobacter TaxID=222 RepID=UPI00244CA05C|nr:MULTISPECIES: hypothetical protein [Achromobacter]MDG9971314.1 hypothetical protein [Achromobacter mucicolens]